MAVRAQRLLRHRASAFPLLVFTLVFAPAVTAASGEIEPASDVFLVLGGATTNGPARSVATLADDRFVMVWPAFDDRIVAQIFDAAGEPVSDGIDVDTDVPNSINYGSPVVARWGDGFVVVWHETGLRKVFARSFAADGTSLSGAVELFIYGHGFANPENLQVVGDGDGPMALILTSSVYVIGRWFDPQTGPLGDAFSIAQPSASDLLLQSDALLAGHGEVLAVAWTTLQPAPGSNTYHLKTQVFDRAGDPLSPVQPVAAVVGEIDRPALAVAPGAGYAVFWSRTILGMPDALFAHRFSSAGQPAGGDLELVAGGTDPIFQPRATGDGHGNWLVAWNAQGEVEVQAFTTDGQPLRSPIPVGADPVNGFTDLPALFPEAGDARGGFTAFWRQYFVCPFECPVFPPTTWGRHFTAGCLAGGDSLCLTDERFRVEVAWQDQHNGGTGTGNAVPLTEKSGTFWFFRDGNLELMTKILDARSVNGHFWFFSGAMTEVGYDITVTDTTTGDHRTYHNEPGTFRSFADPEAFDDAPGGEGAGAATTAERADRFEAAPLPGRGRTFRGGGIRLVPDLPPFEPLSAAAAIGPSTPAVGPCPAAPQVICLGENDRFALSVDWIDPHNGGAGSGQGSPLTDDTGAFWFFNPANLELAVKVLDGRPVNGHFWVFYASLTDVEFRLTITDRESGTTRFFDNPPFHLASAGETEAF